ncbi:beta-glucosidase/6-phospho-beta-glucosidase/beta-galactosidase [Streptosporangium brasiliense]|uniref:beta-glucosidase n=1 Tax=Streptosporangium brasiliense TaxID=47480 RepID=A0ABT9RAG1_9ACTN|nr:family 1 glycosylhydrolase [Streptosporangium brasiliense]MDP9866250.1 beta-glucosidase/6-phospho-beta-glucosidase/beta-galactosidase [Streptosporangium brasiliense]
MIGNAGERGDTGDVACEHYFHYADDVRLMSGLGLGAYRFSVAWPRVQPDGTGRINPRGLDFYSRLVDRLLEAGITPYATLYHWDLPQALEDAEAVRRIDALLTRQFLDPALRGEYPAELLAIAERNGGLADIRDGDLGTVNQPIETIGINYYNPCVVESGPGEAADAAWPGSEDVRFRTVDVPVTAMGWPIVPNGLSRLLLRLADDYPGVGLVVTENGAAFDDVVEDGRVHDAGRTGYLDGHLRAVHAAIAEGADVRGYLVWSLLDNFEWAEGYRRRFGIVHVDFATQRRLLKDSALWYREVIKRNGLLGD